MYTLDWSTGPLWSWVNSKSGLIEFEADTQGIGDYGSSYRSH